MRTATVSVRRSIGFSQSPASRRATPNDYDCATVLDHDGWFRAMKKLTLVLSKSKELEVTVNLRNFKLPAVVYFSHQDNDGYLKAVRQRELRQGHCHVHSRFRIFRERVRVFLGDLSTSLWKE